MTDINKELRLILDSASRKIKERFPHTVSAYEGFEKPRNCYAPRIEVFLLSEDELPDFLRYAGTLVAELGWFNEVDFHISGWTKAESMEHFRQDVLRLTCLEHCIVSSWGAAHSSSPPVTFVSQRLMSSTNGSTGSCMSMVASSQKPACAQHAGDPEISLAANTELALAA